MSGPSAPISSGRAGPMRTRTTFTPVIIANKPSDPTADFKNCFLLFIT